MGKRRPAKGPAACAAVRCPAGAACAVPHDLPAKSRPPLLPLRWSSAVNCMITCSGCPIYINYIINNTLMCVAGERSCRCWWLLCVNEYSSSCPCVMRDTIPYR